MVAPLVAAAGIGAVGSLLGGVTGGKGAKKAAKIQAQATQQQIAANNANRDYLTGLSQPTIDRGNAAGATAAGLLGLGDADASAKALETWRGSTGYQDLLKTGLGAVTANAYASGMGDSGATAKRLQERGMNLANQNQGVYMANLNNLIQTGNSAIGNIAGVSTATTQANNQATQAGADASGNAALVGSAAWQQSLKNLTNVGLNAAGGQFSSSYGGGVPGGYAPPVMYGGLNPRWA